jgi:Sulfatase/Glycine transporter
MVRPAKGAPNIVLILLDDVGFGQFSVSGGGVQSPHMEKLAAQGLRYNRFHTTALCSPTRAALLTGRNHHVTGNGGITEAATGAEKAEQAGAGYIVAVAMGVLTAAVGGIVRDVLGGGTPVIPIREIYGGGACRCGRLRHFDSDRRGARTCARSRLCSWPARSSRDSSVLLVAASTPIASQPPK